MKILKIYHKLCAWLKLYPFPGQSYTTHTHRTQNYFLQFCKQLTNVFLNHLSVHKSLISNLICLVFFLNVLELSQANLSCLLYFACLSPPNFMLSFDSVLEMGPNGWCSITILHKSSGSSNWKPVFWKWLDH